MKTKKLPPNWRRRYEDYLRERERSEGTVRQYLRDVEHFFKQQKSDSAMPDSYRLQDWKEGLIEQGYAVSSINGMIAAVNGLLCCLGLEREKLKPLRQQRKIFCQKERQLSREEYLRLVNTALQKGDRRLALVLQTICSTGIRISELQYITVEALHSRRAAVHNKGKLREILLPRQLCGELKRWAKALHIRSGPVFVTRNGLPLDRSNHLVADERAVYRGAGGPEQGFSAQSAPPVRPHLLPDGEGSEPSGRPAGSQQHPDHPHLYYGERGGAPARAGEDAASAIKKHHKMLLLW